MILATFSVFKKLALVLVVLVLLYLATVFTLTLIYGPRYHTPQSSFDMAEEAQTRAALFDTVSFDGRMSDTALQIGPAGGAPDRFVPSPALVEAAIAALPPSLQGEREQLGAPDGAMAAALEFTAAIGSGDPKTYGLWRSQQGFYFREGYPTTDYRDPDWFEGPYEVTMGKSRPSGISIQQYFDDMFTKFAAADYEALRPSGIATSPLTVECRYKFITHPDDHMGFTFKPKDGLGSRFWVGGTGGQNLVFWQYDRSMTELVAQHDGIWLATVQLALIGGQGHVIPTRLTLFFDPSSDRGWRVRGWSTNNIGADVGVTNTGESVSVF